MDGDSVRVEGARPDERIISDNVLEDVQKAYPMSAPQAASLHSHPPVCDDTIDRQEAEALAAQLVYKDAEVMVEIVAQADFKPNALNLTGNCSGPARHTQAGCTEVHRSVLPTDWALHVCVREVAHAPALLDTCCSCINFQVSLTRNLNQHDLVCTK